MDPPANASEIVIDIFKKYLQSEKKDVIDPSLFFFWLNKLPPSKDIAFLLPESYTLGIANRTDDQYKAFFHIVDKLIEQKYIAKLTKPTRYKLVSAEMTSTSSAIDAVPDGMLLTEWSAQNDVGRTTTYALLKVLKAMGIPVRSVRRKGVAKPSQFLEGQALQAMNHLLAQHLNGTSLSQLEADHTAAIVAAPQEEPAPKQEPINPASLLARLQAADLAISTGLPLTRQELAWIVGIADTSRIPPSRIRIGRTSLQKWTLLAPTSENLIQVAQTH